MLKPIFTKARLIKRNLLLVAAARSSGLLACGQARPGPDLQQQLLLLQQLQWWSSPQRHDKRVQLFALKIFTHDSVARAGAVAGRASQSRPMRFCVLAVMSAYVALALKSQPDSESEPESKPSLQQPCSIQ